MANSPATGTHGDCHVEAVEKPVNREALQGAMGAYLAVAGMGCPRCAQRVQNALLRLDGVLVAVVSLADHMAFAAYDPRLLTPEDLEEAVARGGGNDGRHSYQALLVGESPALEAPFLG